MTADSARKRVGTTLGTHVNFYVDTILTDPGFNAENVSATPPDLAPVMSRSDLDAIVPFTSFYSAAKTVLGDDCANCESRASTPLHPLGVARNNREPSC